MVIHQWICFFSFRQPNFGRFRLAQNNFLKEGVHKHTLVWCRWDDGMLMGWMGCESHHSPRWCHRACLLNSSVKWGNGELMWMEQIQIPGLDHLKVSGDLHMLGVYPKVLGRIYAIGSLSGLVKEGKRNPWAFSMSRCLDRFPGMVGVSWDLPLQGQHVYRTVYQPKSCICPTPKDKITDEFVEEALASLGGSLVRGTKRI